MRSSGKRKQAAKPEHAAERLDRSGAFLFLSIDMVNSTAYKEREARWPFVLHRFYSAVVAEVRGVSDKFNVWKYIGDEVVFWRHLSADDDLAATVRQTHEALNRVIAGLEALDQQYDLHTRNFIGAKGTMWIAAADHIPAGEIELHLHAGLRHSNRIIHENHVMALEARSALVEQAKLVDFIGPDIDVGFRIAKFAHHRFLLLSAYLGYLLLQRPGPGEAIGEQVRIIACEGLKGVWGGRPYPIIWYCGDWEHVASQFAYDELLGSPLIARIGNQQTWPLSQLVKVLSDTNHSAGAEILSQLIEKS